jgi:hypothetical protein
MGRSLSLSSIGAGLDMVFAKSGQQTWTLELRLIPLSQARYAASSLGNMVEL